MPAPPDTDARPIRVRILGREYPLRVRPRDEALTRDMAAYVDGKMRAFKDAHPEQSDVTAAVVVSLALAEELYTAWEAQDTADAALEAADGALEQAVSGLERRLAEALDTPAGKPSASAAHPPAAEQDGDTPV